MAELRIKMNGKSEFIGVFEHFYENSYFDHISTYYVNLAYKYRVENIKDMPNEQHSEYQWFGVEELLNSEQAHPYVKDYLK
jgi:colanic acid biosynthesis protein WcaH